MPAEDTETPESEMEDITTEIAVARGSSCVVSVPRTPSSTGVGDMRRPRVPACGVGCSVREES